MSSTNFSVGVAIGVLGAAAFGRDAKKIGVSLEDIKRHAAKVELGRNLVGDTLRMTNAMKHMERAGLGASDAFRVVRDKLTEHTRKLREAGVDVRNLAGEYRRLDRAARGLTLRVKGQEQIGAAISQARAAAALVATVSIPVKLSADFQAQIRDIAITGGFAGRRAESDLASAVRAASAATAQSTDAVNQGLGVLVAGGISSAQELSGYATLMGKVATAWKAEMADIGNVILASRDQLGITADSMEATLEALGDTGKAGQFEFKDMAKWIPALAPQFKSLGMQGRVAAAEMGAWLQIARRGAGTTDEAANNFKNFLSKLTSPDTIKDFEKAGINIKRELARRADAGESPISAMLAVIDEYMRKQGPQAAETYKTALTSKDAVEREMAAARLNEAFRLGDLFQDMQAMSFIRPALNAAEDAAFMKESALNAMSLDDDFKRRAELSEKKWQQLGQAWTRLAQTGGDALRPITDLLADKLTGLATGAERLMTAYPIITQALTGIAAIFAVAKSALVTGTLVKGAYNVIAGGVLSSGAGGAVPGTSSPAPNAPKGKRNVWRGAAAPAGAARRVLGRAGAVGALAIGGLMVADAVMADPGRPGEQAGAVGGIGGALAGGAAGAAIGSVVPIIGTAIGGLIGSILGGLGGEWLGEKLGPMLAGVGAQIKTWAEAQVELLKGTWANFSGAFTAAWDAVKAGWTQAAAWLPAQASQLAAWFEALPSRMLDAGRQIIGGLISGIQERFAALKATVTGIGSSIVGWFKSDQQIKSPSRVWAGMGEQLMAGLSLGIGHGEAGALAALGDVTRRLAAPVAASVALSAAPVLAAPQQSVSAPVAPVVQSAGIAQPVAQQIEIHIHQQPGESAQVLAERVAEVLRRRERIGYHDYWGRV